MNSVLKTLSFTIFFLAVFIFAFSVAGFAQDLDKVTMSGKITDSNKAAIAGATVSPPH